MTRFFLGFKKIGVRFDALITIIIDQGVISTVNFVTSIMIARSAGSEDLGVYAICFTIMVLASAASESVITSPYMVLFRTIAAERQSLYRGSVLVHQVLLGLALSALLAFISAALILTGNESDYASAFLLLAAVLPFVLARESARRYSMAHLRPMNSLIIDSLTAGVQMMALGLLALTSNLSVSSALIVIAMANILGLVPWWLREKPVFHVEANSVRSDLIFNAHLGLWNFAALTTFIMQLYLAQWLLAVAGSAYSVGIFAASPALVMISNPLTQSIANHLMPRSVLAWSEAGFDALKSLLNRWTFFLALALLLVAAPLAVFGDSLLILLFGEAFAGNGAVVAALAAAAVIRASAMASYIGLWSIGRSDINAAVNVFGLILLGGTLLVLYEQAGLIGAALAVLVADFGSGVARFALFRRCGSHTRGSYQK